MVRAGQGKGKFDEEMQKDESISRAIYEELEKISIEVEKQIKARTEKWNEDSRVTLVTDPSSKVFILTNENIGSDVQILLVS